MSIDPEVVLAQLAGAIDNAYVAMAKHCMHRCGGVLSGWCNAHFLLLDSVNISTFVESKQDVGLYGASGNHIKLRFRRSFIGIPRFNK